MISRRALTLGRIGGIEVRVSASWLAVVALITWSFWNRFEADSRFGGVTAFFMALAAAALLFVSVLAHELAHGLEARYRGIPVGGITLFLFGGVTETLEARRPVDEFAMTAVGPFTSLAFGCGLGLVAVAADHAGLHSLAAVCGLVGWLNVGLAVFNLFPGAPLDGGRILRAIVWRVTGDRDKAAAIAARAGQGVAALLQALGLFQVFFVPAAFVNGLWMAFIGFFMMGAATAELADAKRHRALAGVPLYRLAERPVDSIPPGASLQEAIDGWFAVQPGRDAFFVSDDTGRPIGVLTLDDVRRRDREGRAQTRVGEAMRPIEALPRLAAGASGAAALDGLAHHPAVVVDEDGEPVAVVTPRSLMAQLRRVEELEGVS